MYPYVLLIGAKTGNCDRISEEGEASDKNLPRNATRRNDFTQTEKAGRDGTVVAVRLFRAA